MVDAGNHVRSVIDSYACGIDHQIVVVRITPAAACIVFVVSDPGPVDPLDFRLCLFRADTVLHYASLDFTGKVSIAEDLQQVRIVPEDIVCAAAQYHAWPLCCKLLYKADW